MAASRLGRAQCVARGMDAVSLARSGTRRMSRPQPASPAELEARLMALIRRCHMLMTALRAARAVDPPDWLIGAGVIRDRVWDQLHGFTRPGPVRDVDLAYFDSAALGADGERRVQSALAARAPDIAWDVT